MDLETKQLIAVTARRLIRQLELCDDEDFVELILNCVASADEIPLEVERL